MHAVEGAAIFADSDQLTVEDFSMQGLEMGQGTPVPPLPPMAQVAQMEASAAASPEMAAGRSVRQAVEVVEENLIRDAMNRHQGNKLRVAAELGISRSYLYKRLSETGLDWTRRPAAPEPTRPPR